MKKNFTLITLATFLLFNCRKKEPLPEVPDADPVFYMEGKINGIPVQFQAGNNDYFMYASFERTHDQLYVFRGDLKQNCSGNCGYSASLLINDYRASANGSAMLIDSAVHLGNYFFNDKTNWPDVIDVAFVPSEIKKQDKQYTWNIIDEKGSVVSSQQYSLIATLSTTKTYTVTHTNDDLVGTCNPTLVSVVNPGNSFQIGIKTSRNDTSIAFNAVTSESGIYTYDWDFGDAATANSQNPTHVFQSGNIYRVKLTVKNANNETCVTYYQVNTNGNSSCDANFTNEFYPLDFSKVYRTITFLLTDPSGKVYSSELALQLPGDFATITEVSNYDKTSDGKLTKKIKLHLNCVLKGADGDVRLTDVNAVMAVAFE